MKRGEIWWASLEEPRGSEPGYKRLVVIVSSDAFNQSKIQTVIVAIVTSNSRLAKAPGNIPIAKRDSALSKESVINVSQILTIDKSFLVEKAGRLPDKKISALDEGLKLSLSIF